MKNLKNYQVQELSVNEMKEVEGGFFYWVELWGGFNTLNISRVYNVDYSENLFC